MPAQKRPHPPDGSLASDSSPSPPPPPDDEQRDQVGEGSDGGGGGGGEHGVEKLQEDDQKLDSSDVHEKGGDSNGDAGSPSSPSDGGSDEFIMVKLSEIRKEVQCPICLGIIRKTRTVMECLHRFCRECIDKSMRLGNNECPACRTHCASRRSLRDDPNYDSLIAALYPDIDRYEEEELAFHEEEKSRNKKIQDSISETLRRQTEALGKRKSTVKATAVALARRSQANYRNNNNYLRGRGRNGSGDNALTGSDDDNDEDVNGHDGGQYSSSADERSPERKPKRTRRCTVPRASPTKASTNIDAGSEDDDDHNTSMENRGTPPLQIGSREIPAWGKGGARSQTRHGNPSGSSVRLKGMRMTKMVEFLRNLDENEDKLDLHVTLLPLDEGAAPGLERPHLCCRPTLSIRHLCQFIALQAFVKDEDVEVFARKPPGGALVTKPSTAVDKTPPNPLELHILGRQESLAALYSSFSSHRGDLVLVYRIKPQS